MSAFYWRVCFDAESSILQLKLKALILDVIHNISVVKQLNQAGVTSPDSWAWRKQLRFYMDTNKRCVIHMVDAQFSYTYEYQVCLRVLYIQPPGRGTASNNWKMISFFLPDYLKPQQSELDSALDRCMSSGHIYITEVDNNLSEMYLNFPFKA